MNRGRVFKTVDGSGIEVSVAEKAVVSMVGAEDALPEGRREKVSKLSELGVVSTHAACRSPSPPKVVPPAMVELIESSKASVRVIVIVNV